MAKNYNEEDRQALRRLTILLLDQTRRDVDQIASLLKHAGTCERESHRVKVLGEARKLVLALFDQMRYVGMAEAEQSPHRMFPSPEESLADIMGQQDKLAAIAARDMGEVYQAPGEPGTDMDKMANAPLNRTLQ